MQEAGSPRDADAGSEAPLAPGERGIADAFGGKFLVVAGDDDADVGDRVGAGVVAVVLGIEVGEQAVFLDERTVPIPTETGNDGEIRFEAEGVLTEGADLIRTIVAIGFAADENGGAVFTAEDGGLQRLPCRKSAKVSKSSKPWLLFLLMMLSWL